MKQTQTETTVKQPYTVANSLVNYYLAIMFSFFPLFLTEQYAHARLDKYWFYLIATGILVISVGICMALSHNEAKRVGQSVPLIKPLSVTDVLTLCFLGFAVISTVFSPYPADAFLGTGGRNNGLLLLLMYTLMYFTVTRNYVCKDYVFIIYLSVSAIIALLTVLNFFYIDPLGMLEGYDEATIADFGSTLGNKNIIAAFMCVYLPVSVMTFVVTENKILRIVSGVAIAFAYMGLLSADSTSDILGLFVILPVAAIFSARRFDYLRRYMLAMTILFLSGKLLLLFATAVGDHNKGFEFMQQFLIYHPLTFVPIAVFGCLYLLMLLIGRKGDVRYPAKAVQIILIILFSIGIIAAVGSFVYFSFIDTKTDLGNFKKLLRFDDYWGEAAYVDKVTLKVIEDGQTMVMSLRSGAIDMAGHLEASQVAELPDLTVLEGSMNLVQALYLNNAVAPFDNILVRQALCYAIDKHAVIDLASDGHGFAVGSSMYPAFGKYFVEELTDYYTVDTEKAKELLAEAGYPDGFEFTITVPSNYTPHVDAAQVIVSLLEQANIGVTAKIEQVEWASWYSDVYQGRDFESTISGMDASTLTASAMLSRFTSTSAKNFITFENEDYDAAYAAAVSTVDVDEQTELFKQCETILTEQAANVYIQDLADFYVMQNDIGGYEFYPLYVMDLSNVYRIG